MPRSVIVLSAGPGFFSNLLAALKADTRFIDLGDCLHCNGVTAPLTNIYPVDTVPVEWDGWASSTGGMPDPRTMSQLIFECRSPEWVAEVGELIAQQLDSPVWIVDAADTAWPADQIDPAKVALA